MSAAPDALPHSVHIKSAALVENKYSHAVCTCGWRSPARKNLADVVEDQDEHLADPDRPPEWIFTDRECAPIEYLRRSGR